jgi:tight adherence protein B
MLILIVAISAGVCVAALVGGITILLQGGDQSVAEDRLSTLTGKKGRDSGKALEQNSLLASPLDETRNLFEDSLSKFLDVQLLFDQADVQISPTKFAVMVLGAAGLGGGLCFLSPAPKLLTPIVAIVFASGPIFWLFWTRGKRFAKFNKQLPEALELLSRSLRAGHSLASGFGLVAGEMPQPIAREFGRVFDEQNFGISLEAALQSMTKRVPNMDVRFFATAVMLQRQTGGDLAEILDKIGRLIRARFTLAGQIQALTGEGRLSGIVLLALPPGLFAVMYFMNRDYAMSLFTDPMGKKLLAMTVVMQVMGAFVIRKIINIKV